MGWREAVLFEADTIETRYKSPPEFSVIFRMFLSYNRVCIAAYTYNAGNVHINLNEKLDVGNSNWFSDGKHTFMTQKYR